MDKYTKIKKIGEGSFGKALLVKSKVNGKQYVVKEINMQRMSPRERKEAKKETSVLAQLNHTNIVTYLESFEEIGNLYIVMDYCDGGDLFARINLQRGILFNESQILDWFAQICLAMKHIHDRKILHRDIKSQNIFLTKANVVKLGDFGIAKVLNSTVELARTCIGTPYYLSPEICENRPYNNKSDIWSMGCVLYELTTLKHAFEAGNMKNLVLKIIRGSYPPVPSKYSYELRNLIGALFKRNPRDRPSVNNILRKPLISNRVPKFLSEAEYADEFSHTVMHGVKLKQQVPAKVPRELPPGPAPRPLPAKRPQTPGKYDPKSVYGPSVARPSSAVRKSKEKENRRSSSSSNNRRPPSAGPAGDNANRELAMKKKELLDKERKRRDEIKRKEEEYARQHRELQEKQKSNGALPKAADVPKSPSPVMPQAQLPLKDRPNYEQYHAYLDKIDQQRNRDQRPGVAAWQGENAAKEAAEAADRARRVDEFLQRKKEAALNKARGQGAGLGAAAALGKRPVVPKATPVKGQPSKSSSGQNKPAVKDIRNKQEQEYLERLKKIRLQNFNDRRALQERNAAKVNEAEVRKKKIECLRAQAESRAQKLKAELEKKRREAFNLGAQKYKEEHALRGKKEENAREQPQRPVVTPKPAPVMPVTAAMQAIGAKPLQVDRKPAEPAVSMTAMMEAIGAKPKEVPAPAQLSSEKSSVQQKKDEILKRINEKPPVPDRPKWSAPVMPKMQEEAPERPKWAGGDGVSLGKLKLEETASQMESTGEQDLVIKNPPLDQKADEAPVRKQWGKPAGTVVNILHEAKVDSSTILINPPQSPESASPASSTGSVPAVGRSPVKGTLVISKSTPADQTEKLDSEVVDQEAVTAVSIPPPAEAISTVTTSPPKSTLVIDKSESQLSIKEGSPRSSSEMKKSKEKLFEKVELLEDDDDEDMNANDIRVEEIEDDEEEEETGAGDAKKAFLNATAGVMLGLTIGHFDVGNPKVLRTCSLPDLSKALNSENEEDLEENVAASLILGGLDSDNDEENEEENLVCEEISENSSEEKKDQTESQEKEAEELEDDGDEDDDLETMRQTMQSLLIDEDGPVSPLSVDSGKRSLSPKKSKKLITSPEPEEDLEESIEENVGRISVSASSDSLLSDGPVDTIIPGKEEWCSDEDEECAEEDDLFCRLEESRLELEEELGCDSFLQAYKSVQAIHEDEDENIEDGSKLVEQILGDKKHLYDKIVKLVMADGAFTEDND